MGAMEQSKTQAAPPRHAERGPAARRQPEQPEQQRGPQPAAPQDLQASASAEGAPAVARAADELMAGEGSLGTASRARLSGAAQRSVGNARLGRMLGTPVQGNLTVSAPDDAAEQEAERTADAVMRMPEPPMPPPQRAGARAGQEEQSGQPEPAHIAQRAGIGLGAQRKGLETAKKESVEARLARQAATIVQVFSQKVVDADEAEYAGIVFTIRHTGEELVPGFAMREPRQPRPSGMIPRLVGTVSAELRPILEMVRLSGEGHYRIAYGRNRQGYMQLQFTEATERELPLGESGHEAPSQGSLAAGQGQLEEEKEEAFLRIIDPTVGRVRPAGTMTGGVTRVSQEVAFELLNNLSRGEPAFKPELGKGGCTWFVTEGNPYVGINPAKNVSIPAEVAKPTQPLVFDESILKSLHEEQLNKLNRAELEQRFREHEKLPPDKPLNRKARQSLQRFASRLAESRMWDEVGRRVRDSAVKVGEVILKNSDFSKSGDGKFLVVADAEAIRIRGGPEAIISALERSGATVEPVVRDAAVELAKRLKWAGRVRAVFHYGGRVLIVMAIAADAYKIYHAKSKLKAVITSAGGWGGATAAGLAFAAWWTPADVAGPLAWAIHGVGTLVAGGIGYWLGSEVTRTIYELVAE